MDARIGAIYASGSAQVIHWYNGICIHNVCFKNWIKDKISRA